MPTYDPAVRAGGGGSVGNLGATSAVVPKPPNTANNDLIRVAGKVGNGAQINAPDGTWTRVNGVVSSYQVFTKRAGGAEPASYTFTWDGSNQPNIFNSLAIYSQGGGTISLDTGTLSEVGSATQKTSDAVTPSKNALVLVSYQEFVISEPGPPIGPGGLTQVQAVGGFGSPSIWSGYVYVQAGVSSGTFIASNNGGDPGSNFHWSSDTLSLISSIVNPASPPFIDDEVVFAPATSQTFLPPFIDDEVVFAPTTGIGAMHTTTENAEVALQATSASTRMRVTTENAELAIQHLLSATNLRITQMTAEIALQAQPPVSPVDFEIQTPGIIRDSAQQETGNRLLLGVNCNISGVPQILTPILIIDGIEYTLPRITSMSRVIIDMPIHGFHGRFWEGVRLTGRLTGRVEVFLVDISTKQGVPSPRAG